MELGLNTSIDTSAVSLKSKVETPKVLSPLTETKENNINVFEDFNKLSSLKEGSLKVKTISLSSDEAKNIGFGKTEKIGITTSGALAGIIAGGAVGVKLSSKLHGDGNMGTALIRVTGCALVGGIIGGITAGAFANKDSKSPILNTSVTTTGAVAGGITGAITGLKSSYTGGNFAMKIGGGVLAGALIGGFATGALVNNK